MKNNKRTKERVDSFDQDRLSGYLYCPPAKQTPFLKCLRVYQIMAKLIHGCFEWRCDLKAQHFRLLPASLLPMKVRTSYSVLAGSSRFAGNIACHVKWSSLLKALLKALFKVSRISRLREPSLSYCTNVSPSIKSHVGFLGTPAGTFHNVPTAKVRSKA